PCARLRNPRRFMFGGPRPGKRKCLAAEKSLSVMCPACWCSPDGLLALMESANRGLIIRGDRCPNETAGFSRLRQIDRLCHHASLLSRKHPVAFDCSKLALAPLIRSQRKYWLPRLVMPPSRVFPPVEFCRGTKPSQAANSRPERLAASDGLTAIGALRPCRLNGNAVVGLCANWRE